MREFLKELMVASMPSPKGLLKLPPPGKHHDQGPERQDEGQQKHRARFHLPEINFNLARTTHKKRAPRSK
ncbi:MAG TPA: hypothetical protein VFC07_03920 [Verrucomicrobiae bacterium]|nr:hypothetical protein [Verrucomicrobiae bacterium]